MGRRLTGFERAGYAVGMSALRLCAFVVVVAVFSSSCVEPKCEPSNCAGCCDASGACQVGTEPSACGAAGASCSACDSTQTCSSQQCESMVTTGVECAVPDVVDFGVVLLNSTTQRQLEFVNDSTESQTVTTSLANATGFTLAPSGAFAVAPGATQPLVITFAAPQLGNVSTTLSVQRGATCAAVNVRITARVVEGFVTLAPDTIDFGHVPTQATATRSIVLENLGGTPVQISNVATSAGFAIVGPASFTIAPTSSATVPVTFRPMTLGARTGTLTLSTNAPGQPAMTVTLRGIGGGPVIDVADLLTVAPTTPLVSQSAQLTVRNLGVAADASGNLRFSTPAFSLVPLGSATANDFNVALSPAYDHTAGVASGRSTTLTVTFTPSSVGMKSAELHLFTNDFATPEKVVRIEATAVAAAPCTWSVSPTGQLDFGRARPYSPIDWPLTVTNTGTTDCDVLSARVVTGDAFSVQGFSMTTLAPGATTKVLVRYTPPTVAGPVTGTLRIHSASTTTPTRDVPLTAAVRPDCLLTLPAVDFGAAPVGCRTAPATVSVVNTCATPVTISGATVSSGEFTLASAAGATLAANSTHDFVAQYQPARVGDDAAVLVVSSVQAGVTAQHVVPLRGRGVATSLISDSFTPQTTTRADVLFVIDDSCSMASRQAELASLAPALMPSSPTSTTVGLSVGVITTDLSNPDRARLRRTTSGAALVTSSTPNAAATLAQLFDVGTSGGDESCLEPTNLALSDEYLASSTDNAALRGDSRLAVVCVTDAPEQSPHTASYELARLSLSQRALRPDALSYSVIGPFLPSPPSGCTYDGANTAVHEQALTRFSGVQEEICTPNWSTTMSRVLGPVATPTQSRFTLSQRVDVAAPSLAVSINGTSLPAVDPVSGATHWAYDDRTNQLTFVSPYEPEPGRNFVVSYAPLCF